MLHTHILLQTIEGFLEKYKEALGEFQKSALYKEDDDPHHYATFAYDAVWTMALALHRANANLQSVLTLWPPVYLLPAVACCVCVCVCVCSNVYHHSPVCMYVCLYAQLDNLLVCGRNLTRFVDFCGLPCNPHLLGCIPVLFLSSQGPIRNLSAQLQLRQHTEHHREHHCSHEQSLLPWSVREWPSISSSGAVLCIQCIHIHRIYLCDLMQASVWREVGLPPEALADCLHNTCREKLHLMWTDQEWVTMVYINSVSATGKMYAHHVQTMSSWLIPSIYHRLLNSQYHALTDKQAHQEL